jgi:signal transduction histidine kinase
MIHGFVQQSKGKVWLRSEPGHGTQVELWLPRCAPDASSA